MIDFVKETHEYFVNGVRLPSVSEIMAPLSSSYYSKVNSQVLEQARIRGTLSHEAIDDYLLFGVTKPGYEDVIKEFKRFLEREKMTILANEMRLTNGEYCGTVDLIGIDESNKVHLIDIKFTYKINKPLVSVQLSAYLQLCDYNHLGVWQTDVLHFSRDKEGHLMPYDFKPVRPNHKKWEELLNEQKNKSGGH